jgi:hypothetical protein
MNDHPKTDAAWEDWAAALPKPQLSSQARARSLDAALAAFHAAEKPRRQWINFHTISWAACWLVSGVLWWEAPSAASFAPTETVEMQKPMASAFHLQEQEMTILLAAINRKPQADSALIRP